LITASASQRATANRNVIGLVDDAIRRLLNRSRKAIDQIVYARAQHRSTAWLSEANPGAD
jgi:hypothetical protein